ncbi:MAG: MFS transporter [Planctomycetaceae bacterium]|nr:MFS transporter [Planctomycetaceae bacterium]
MSDLENSSEPAFSDKAKPTLSGKSPAVPVDSQIRYHIVGVSVLMAVCLYLDRVCLGEIVKTASFNDDVKLSKDQIGQILSSFFITYALFQVPAGWISDRFGARKMLTGYILAWSVLTGLTGFMTGLTGLLLARLGCGIAQAGAYPTSSAVIRRWIRLDGRGKASALVSFGGRLGGTLAPILTAVCILSIGGWRQTLWLYGVLGIGIAAAYHLIVRDRPAEHPRCTSGELEFIGRPADDRRPELREILRMVWACCCSVSLWLNSLGQFCINIGWAFLITWLPTYLKEKHAVSDTKGAMLVTIVLAMGMLGQLLGGWATDAGVRRFGLRFGRVLPISAACTVAGMAYLSCLVIDSMWGIVACCAVVSLMTDTGNPSIWGFMQDVGGRNTAAVFGWANMWGNLGAAYSSRMVPQLMEYGESSGSGMQLVFIACASAFFIAGIAALGMNATRPLQPAASPVT